MKVLLSIILLVIIISVFNYNIKEGFRALRCPCGKKWWGGCKRCTIIKL